MFRMNEGGLGNVTIMDYLLGKSLYNCVLCNLDVVV